MFNLNNREENRIIYKSFQNKEIGPIIYWMSRDQRSIDNYALSIAQKIAIDQKQPLIVFFNKLDTFLNATEKQFNFMLQGLKSVQRDLEQKNIKCIVLEGDPIQNIEKVITKTRASTLIKDFSPLKISKQWHQDLINNSKINYLLIDAHNFIPVNLISNKQEYSARTLRIKYVKLINDYLNLPKLIIKHPHSLHKEQENYISSIDVSSKVLKKVSNPYLMRSGQDYAKEKFEYFIQNKYDRKYEFKNDPLLNATSRMSAYIHFGQISVSRMAIEIIQSRVMKNGIENELKGGFLDQLLIRRELAENFCYYNDNYDSFEGLPNWGKITLLNHIDDVRPYIYDLEKLENAKTHDTLWNAAQNQMKQEGYMHGYLRMYWAKKILEWTPNPMNAINYAIYLNDKYELDGRDPNGYAGILWSIGGLHDRPWFEREVFGLVRYMSGKSILKKYPNTKIYIQKYT